MANERIVVDLIARTQQFTTGMARAGRSADQLTGKLMNAETAGTSAFRKVGKVAATGGLVMGTAVLGGVAASISAYADFDAKMNESLAIMGDVSEFQRGEMSDAAREIATTTRFSAEQAAESYFYLASAGLDAEQSMAALPQVAAFAQAGMFDMATATDLATDAQSALGLTSDNAQENLKGLTRVTDVFVKANTLANTSVQQVSEAITNKLGGALRTYKIDIEEGAAVLAAYADQGLKGAEAGEALNIALRDLKGSAVDNADAFAAAGIKVLDQNGNFRNMADIVADLTGAFGGLSVAQQTQLAQDLGFQDRSFKNIQLLFGQAEAIRAYETELRQAGGTTEEVALKQMDTLNEQLGLIGSKFKDVALEAGEQLAPTFQEMLPAIEAMVEGLGNLVVKILPALTSGFMRFGEGVMMVAGWFDESSARTANLMRALRQQADAVRDGRDANLAAADSMLFLAEHGSLTVDAIEKVGKQAGLSGAEMLAVEATVLNYARAHGIAADQMASLRQEMVNTTIALVESGEATMDEVEAVYGSAFAWEVTDVMRRRAAQAAQEGADATGEAVDAIDEEVEQLGILETALADAEEAQQSLADTVRAFADPTFKAAKSMDKLREAEQRLEAVQGDAEASAEDLAEAQLDLYLATLEAQGALDAFDASSIEEQIGAFAEVMGVAYDEAWDLFETLGLLDGKQVNMVVDIEQRINTIATGPTSPDAAQRAGDLLDQALRQGVKGLAAGGPLGAGQVALVGERGPELFVPTRSGTIVPNGALGGVNITVNNPTTRDLDRDLQIGILKAQTAGLVEVF